MSKTKILVAGIGGIGGYFGGHLAKTFENNPEIEIYFLARGQSLQTIKSQGIILREKETEFSAQPAAVIENPSPLGIMDYIILSVKSYDLLGLLDTLKDNISPQTVIIPLLNGVEGPLIIKDRFPDALVTEGCANIIVRLNGPGIIESFSSFKSLHFGVQNLTDARLQKIHDIFIQAGIDAVLTTDIKEQIWFKYIFIAAAAATTTYYNAPFGKIRENKESLDTFLDLVDEAFLLAEAEEITLREGAKEKIIANLNNGPAEATTSMHSDVLSGKGKSEVDNLVGYPVRRARELKIELPLYNKIYQQLSAKN